MGDWRVYSWLSTDFYLCHQTNSKVKMKRIKVGKIFATWFTGMYQA